MQRFNNLPTDATDFGGTVMIPFTSDVMFEHKEMANTTKLAPNTRAQRRAVSCSFPLKHLSEYDNNGVIFGYRLKCKTNCLSILEHSQNCFCKGSSRDKANLTTAKTHCLCDFTKNQSSLVNLLCLKWAQTYWKALYAFSNACWCSSWLCLLFLLKKA